MVALAAFGVDAGVVEVAAQVVVAGGGVGEQVPDDDQQGPADGHDGFLAAAAAGDAPVPLAQEGVGAARRGGSVAEDPGQVAVAVAGGVLAFLLPGGFLDAGGELGPGDQVPGGGEPPHVGPDLGQDRAGGDGADAGDLGQALDRCGVRGGHLLDPLIQRGDVGVDSVGPGQHLGQQERVVIGEVAGERLLQRGDLAAHHTPRQLRQRFRIALPADQRGQHLAARDAEDVRDNHAQLDARILQQLLHPLLLRGPRRHQVGAVAGDIAQLPDLRAGARNSAGSSAARRPCTARWHPA